MRFYFSSNKGHQINNQCERLTFFSSPVFKKPGIYIYNLSQASFRRHSLHNSINTVPQVKSKTICFSCLTYISAVLNGLHQGEWPLQASYTIQSSGKPIEHFLVDDQFEFRHFILDYRLYIYIYSPVIVQLVKKLGSLFQFVN